MGASEMLRIVFAEKNVNQRMLAEEIGMSYQTLLNKMSRNTFHFNTVERMLDALDVDIVFVDRETGKFYGYDY